MRQKKGECLVWGKPPTLVRAKYTTTAGEERESLLLASGWWGVSRHFHYIPEITASFFWCSPALTGAFYPYFYVLYLTILLTDRAFRDDQRCKDKYGKYWDQYCALVPYKIIPGIV